MILIAQIIFNPQNYYFLLKNDKITLFMYFFSQIDAWFPLLHSMLLAIL